MGKIQQGNIRWQRYNIIDAVCEGHSSTRGCLQFESPSPAEPGRGCEKSCSDGIIQNEVVL